MERNSGGQMHSKFLTNSVCILIQLTSFSKSRQCRSQISNEDLPGFLSCI